MYHSSGNYEAFARTMPGTRIFYAVKANPAPEILSLLASLGSCFDTASVVEVEMALAAGATPDRVSFGNTIKKERDIAKAHALGIKLFAVDSDVVFLRDFDPAEFVDALDRLRRRAMLAREHEALNQLLEELEDAIHAVVDAPPPDLSGLGEVA